MRNALWPRGGWLRAASYMRHRLTRLPDPPHRIARGIWAGVFVSFTPLIGFHIPCAAMLAWIMRGNLLAAVFATVIGNPLTFPLIAVTSVELGHMILGTGVEGVPASRILAAFADAGQELWENFLALFTAAPTEWARLRMFWRGLFLPYLIGGIVPGIVLATAGYYLSLPLIGGYQRLRERRRRVRAEMQRGGAAARLRGDPPTAGGARQGGAAPETIGNDVRDA
jgi:hypothetical protein